MNIDDRIKIAVLTKYYGSLLTKKQQQIVAMYVDNNLSLAEVGEELKITRQAVKDALDKAVQTLQEYENNLHFIARDDKIRTLLDKKTLADISLSTKMQIISLLEE